ncbi:MAG: pyruvate dehydrogenase [Anaerolineales bacterium]|nr:pyruvate dehydrogenase [Anaerolineales bacterium]
MKTITFSDAIDHVLALAMERDPRIVVIGEDVQGLRMNLFVRFGKDRVRNTPISESAFVGAAVAASMAGLRPVVEVQLVDFIGVTLDALLNHAAKLGTFSGGKWNAPFVLRASCGGGYGDAGQHEQSLWGWLAHIPGLTVVVPSNPIDAGGLMLAAIDHESPVIYLEHKLLSTFWLESMGIGGRDTVQFDVPEVGAKRRVPNDWQPIPLGKAVVLRDGDDIALISVGVGVHRAMEAAEVLYMDGISASVIDLRTVTPLDQQTVVAQVSKTGRMLVVDEDYEAFGLSGELAAVILEAGVGARYVRVCTRGTIPYSHLLELETLPNCERIVNAAKRIM